VGSGAKWLKRGSVAACSVRTVSGGSLVMS
jgi:hypothetical protein